MPKNEVYLRLKAWALSAFNSQKDAQQVDDKDVGLIAFKSSFTERYNTPDFKNTKSLPYDIRYHFLLKSYYKQGKVKLIISDVTAESKDSPILIYNYQSVQDSILQTTPMLNKKKYKEFFYEGAVEMRKNFEAANTQFIAVLNNLEHFLKSQAKAESDF